MKKNLQQTVVLTCLAVSLLAVSNAPAASIFVAYNDHEAGSGTGVNSTTYSVPGYGSPTAGLLRDVNTGANTPVTLTITVSGAPSYGSTAGTPAPGTPLYNTFNGYVDWNGGYYNAIQVWVGDVVTYTFSGLDPARRYSFKGGAVRGGEASNYTNRWTLVEIVGADSFISAHTANAVTSAQTTDLTASQAAFCFGVNHTAADGDMADWESINPGADGTFSVSSTRYTGFVPGGSSTDNLVNYAYAITGIRLEEMTEGNIVNVSITSPAHQSTFTAPANLTIQASTFATAPITKVEFFEGRTKLGESTSAPYSYPWSASQAGTYTFRAVATDNGGLVATSAPVQVSVVLSSAYSGGLFFDGVDDYVTFGAAPGLGGSNFTLEVWFNWNGGGTSASSGSGGISTIPLIAKLRGEFDGNNQDGNYVLGIDVSTWTLAADFEEGMTGIQPGLNHPVQGLTQIGLGEWHHAAVTYDGSTWQIYLDGVLDGSLYVGQPPRWDSIQQAALGTALTSLGVSQGAFSGVLDEARIWNYARSAEQIAGNRFLQISSGTGLVGRWALDETSGQTATDSSGNGHNGTLVNGPIWMDGYAFAVSPLVALTSPTNGAGFMAPVNLTLTATAEDLDGSVTKVEFLEGANKLGESTTAPYSVVWNDVPPGFYTLRAVATDNGGLVTTSAPATIAVYGEIALRQTLVASNSVWKYLDNGSDQGTAWTTAGFDDSQWASGPAELGYGDDVELRPEATVVGYGPDANNKYVTTYFRHYFTVYEPSQITNLVVGLMRDDGAVVYLNGNEIVRDGVPAGAAYNTPADIVVGSTDETIFYPFNSINPSYLVNGTNVLAVEVHQFAYVGYPVTSTDVSFDMELQGDRVMDGNPPPATALTSPSEGAVYTLPTNMVITATASDFDGVSSLAIYANSQQLAASASSFLTFTWTNPPIGSYALRAVASDTWGGVATSAVVNVVVQNPPVNTNAPVVQSVNPAAGNVTSLTSVQVTFSEVVINVDASDLLVNGVAATKVSGSGRTYTFSVTQPAYGPVAITWAAGNGIQDIGVPVLSFDGSASGNTWSYTLLDVVPPTISGRSPAADSTRTNLTQVQVLFSEAVQGVNASDMLINGSPAIGVMGAGTMYIFSFPQPIFGVVTISWAADHGITDLALNSFDGTGAGATWQYMLQAPQVVLVATNAMYTLFKGHSEPSTPISAWREPGFDDSGWTTNQAPFYFDIGGDYYGNTVLSDMYGGYLSMYVRHVFTVENPGVLTNMVIKSKCDDGFIAWVNGVEIFRSSTVGAGDIPYNGNAQNASEPLPWVYNTISVPATVVQAGANVLAIQGLNSTLSSSDFMIDVELLATLVDPSLAPPTLHNVTPSAGDVYSLSTVTVTFSKPVQNVDASDLLINGVPASGVSGANAVWTFTFTQPAFGTVNLTWAASHGITDLDSPPKMFNGTAAGATWSYSLVNPSAPTVASRVPIGGATIGNLTNIQVNFSEAVGQVNASDLLINGLPATGVSGGGASYTFSCVQPAYGNVAITWAGNHGITDLETPANAFDPSRPGNTWQYTLEDQTPPAVIVLNPLAGTTVTNLMELQLAFSEPVSGVDASDLLVNGVPATGLVINGNTYTFSFVQPNATVINVTWSMMHGIADLAVAPNSFDAFAPGSTWQYYTLDNIAPAIASITPPMGATLRSLTQVAVTFNEPVTGVSAGDLLINSVAAATVTGSDAGPYTFYFTQPTTGAVEVVWGGGHGIQDLASPPNAFAGGDWTYVLDPNASFADKIVINEIMFNPASHLAQDEWIELHNTDSSPMTLTGWRFKRGIDFTFPHVTIPGGGYLVIAASVAAFEARYPGLDDVTGDWAGRLSNSDEVLELETAEGELVQRVHYATEGDWARRVRGPVYSGGYRGWDWLCTADGTGPSFELINQQMPQDSGQNWLPSVASEGTPGAANSVASTNIAPLILKVAHIPAMPTSADPVIIRAEIVDELTNGMTVRLNWRNATSTSPGAFSNVEMFDDGAHGDGVAGDRIYGATIPAQGNLAVVEFYVQATDAQSQQRTWPAAAYDGTTLLGQVANALYQVDDTTTTFPQPMCRLIMTGAERQELSGIWASDNLGARIDAAMNGTFISRDGTGTEVRYRSGFRNRGNGTRSATPHNFRVDIVNDNRWHGVRAVNFNTQYTHSQVVGSMTSRMSGLAGEDSMFVRVRVNGSDLANSVSPQYGCYAYQEALNSDWAENHYPLDSQGNLYRCMRTADLHYLGNNWVSYTTGGYNYSKNSNQSENDWSDLFNLTYVLNNTPDSNYTAAVSQVMNMEAAVRYFAVLSLQGFGETALGSDGTADDYSIYRGVNDPRFVFMPHDHDTDFGIGVGARGPTDSIWRAANGSSLVNKLLKWPDFAPLYFAELHRLATGVFAPTNINATMDQLMVGVVPQGTIDTMKSWSAQRAANVLGQIPMSLTVTHSLTTQNGYLRSTSPTMVLSGLGNVIQTRTIKVNGSAATWTAWTGAWSAPAVALQPGINSILVQAIGTNNVEVGRTNFIVWYDSGAGQSVSGTLSTSTVWTPGAGPYNVTGSLSVPDGVTLTVLPGTTVYLASGASINVSGTGRLLAEGTEYAPIRFTSAPGSGVSWGGININNTSIETRISYAHIDSNGSTAVHASGGTVFLDHLTFGNTGRQYVSLDNSSFIVQNCNFPTTTAGFEPLHGSGGVKSGGYGIFLRNFFGAVNGYNDVIDFTGGNRPNQPIVQFIENVFMGSGDDLLDLDGTDAWVEGNIFMHVHKNGSPDSASAVSGGNDGALTSEVTVIGNIFYDLDQAAMGKQGNFYTMFNNTIVRQTRSGGTDTDSGVICMADDGTAEALGMYLEGNIMYDVENLVRNQTASLVTFSNNIMPLAWSGPGGGNRNVDPLFQHVPQLSETVFTNWAQAQVMKQWLSLRAGSPAAGTGPSGLDQGAIIPMGAAISGEPVGATASSTATLNVGINRAGSGIPTAGWPDGSGYTHYRYRLNGGVWSAERPVSTPITLTGLPNGQYRVDVVGRRDAGLYQDDSRYGAAAVVTASRTWMVLSGAPALRINEVLASNGSAVEHEGSYPDVIEIYNASGATVDLTGMRLSDDQTSPDRFRFPAGTTIAAGGYLVVYANNPDGTSGLHTGFNLAKEGGSVYLYDRVERGGALMDAVSFGLQVSDSSVGRLADGQWALTVPTFGSVNRAAAVASAQGVRINEWLTAEETLLLADFVELYNPQGLPAAVGGCYLTDNAMGWPTQHQIAGLSFVPANGFVVFQADGNEQQGAEHLNFKLAPEGGEIALFSPSVELIDYVIYSTQWPDVSQGRRPDGGVQIVSFTQPTPGAPNPATTGTNLGVVVNEVLAANQSIAEGDGSTPDWIELYNTGGADVDLAGLSLSDDVSAPRRWVFPAGARIAAQGYVRVICDPNSTNSTELTNATGPFLTTNFAVKASGGTVAMYDASSNMLSVLNYGLQAPDFSVGRVPNGTGNWTITLPTPSAVNIAASTGNVASLRINEWMASNSKGPDWFEVYNPNAQPVAIGGLVFANDAGFITNATTLRPLSFLGGGGTNGYYQFIADRDLIAGADHVNFKLSAGGDTVALGVPGRVIDSISFTAQAPDISEGRFPDGTATIVRFPGTDSPGESNYRLLTNVVVNEVLAHADPATTNQTAVLEDAIELRNLTGASVNISGWWLSDSKNNLRKYRIPDNTTVLANGFKMFYEHQFNAEPVLDPRSFGLSGANGDQVYLSTADASGELTGYRTSVKFGASEYGASFGRYVNSVGDEHFVATQGRTFGSDDPSSLAEFRTGAGLANTAPKVGPIVVTEIMYHPPDIGLLDNARDEFIELHNTSSAPVPLFDPNYPTNTWRLRDAVDYEFPANVTMQPGSYLIVVSFDPVLDTNALTAFRNSYGLTSGLPAMFGPYRGKLANSSAKVEVYKPDAPLGAGSGDPGFVPYVLVERIKYADASPWPPGADGFGASLQRRVANSYGNDPTNWIPGLATLVIEETSQDTDNDGMPNPWESANGLNPNWAGDAGLDPDGDGMTNLREYQAGTDPQNAASALRLAWEARIVNSTLSVVLTFTAQAGKSYVIDHSDSVVPGNWQPLQMVDPLPYTHIVEFIEPMGAKQFYRVRLQ